MTRATRAHRIVLLALATTAAGACANVLGLTGYQDAASRLCDPCANIADCENTLHAKLEAATDDERKAWLATYDELDCSHSDCTTTAYRCFHAAPDNCAAPAEACDRPEACCAYDYDKPDSGQTCCVSGGGGACCDSCKPCGVLLAESDIAPDLDGLCTSHRETWDALVDCGTSKCKTVCATASLACKACLNGKCKPMIAACNANQAP